MSQATAPAAPPGGAAPAPPAPKPPGKIKSFFIRIGAIPKKLWRMSLPAKAAWLALIALVAVVVLAWTAFLADANSVPWRHSMTPGRVLAVVVLVALIPLVVYRGLKLWLEGDTSRFPDLDFAWRAGLTALERNGLDIATVPVFLILGSSGERQEQALFDSTGLPLRVRAVPEGPAPLHWYANPEAIFICCTEASWTSGLAAFEAAKPLAEMAAILSNLESSAAPAAPAPAQPVFGFQPAGGMPMAALPAAPAPPQSPVLAAPPRPALPAPMPAGGGDDIRGTIMLGQYAANLAAQSPPAMPQAPQYAAPQQQAFAPPSGEDSGSFKGTMMLQSPLQLTPPAAPQSPQYAAPQFAPPSNYAAPQQYAAAPAYAPAPAQSYVASAPAPRQAQTALLAPQESAEQLEKLQHVCRLLRRARSPLCAVNGILTLLPMPAIQGSIREAEELQRAVKSDLRTIDRTLELRCPVTALVVGMEQESGFRELVRRVGRERAVVQRFGQRYDLRSVATAEEMHALCAHVCGAFEDWVYTLFREQGALSRPGNMQLYSLLCKVQLSVKNRLAEILAGGFGYDPTHAGDPPVLFSGCYFAAIGETEDRQAFAKGVFNKLIEEQEQVEWTPRALASNRHYLWLAYTGLILDAALVVALGAMAAWRWIR
ncbi:MAG TPA: type VI secretion protein IcmF/TssM N-terminal domain-containing protein [Pirellulales bacterium]|nr:type VI secretion protein IcmF/TssM N-terminal domain-containing protein [Pirellulales bacterium]